MPSGTILSQDRLQIRQMAQKAALEGIESLGCLSTEVLTSIVYEFGLYQFELEVQNEEIERGRLEVEIARDRFKVLYEHSPAGYVTLDLTGVVLESNSTMCTILGRDKTELVGRPFAAHLDSDSAKSFYLGMELLKKDAGVDLRVIRFLNLPDRLFQAESALLCLPGKDTQFLCLVSDRTESEKAKIALSESEEKFKIVADFSYGWEMWSGPDGDVLYISPSCERISGYTAKEFADQPELINGIVHPEDRERYLAHVHTHLATNYAGELEFRIITKDGRVRWVLQCCQVVHDSEGDERGRRLSNRDITKRKLAEETLSALERRYRELVEFAPLGIFQSSPQGHFLAANPCVAAMYGYDSVQDLMDSVRDIGAQLYMEKSERVDILMAAEQSVVHRMEIRQRRKDGSIMWVALSLRAVRDPAGSILHYEAFTRDISERKQLEEDLKILATTDPLTGITSRRQFLEMAEEELSRCKRYCLPMSFLMLDIDRFKNINDEYGHEVGDTVLKVMSKACLSILRATDEFGRLGGEEFGALLVQTDLDGGQRLAERMRQTVEAMAIKTKDGHVRITVSIGVANFIGSDISLEDIMKLADAALYDAKRTGRNRVCIAP